MDKEYMDKVYILWHIVRYEGKDILGVFKSKERAREFALTYIEESQYDWETDEWHDDAWWNPGMDADLRIDDEFVLP
jgi:hypothetical protein